MTAPKLLKEVAGKEGDCFQGREWNFHIKNKLKSEIFTDKKVYDKQKYFSVIAKIETGRF